MRANPMSGEKQAGPLPMLGRVKSKAWEAKSKWVDDIARAIVIVTVCGFNMLIAEARCDVEIWFRSSKSRLAIGADQGVVPEH